MSIQERRPADNYGSVEQPHLEQPSRKCCKIKYRVRYFYSKGAFLVLLWTSLISATVLPFNDNLASGFNEEAFIVRDYTNSKYWYILLVLLFVSIPLAGWLADRKFGNYKVFKAGSVLLFLAAIVRSTPILLLPLMEDADFIWKITLSLAITIISCSIGLIGTAACLVTALQLGLDQMPDASADNITSFIAWFVFSVFGGFWMSTTLLTGINICSTNQHVIPHLLPAICMAIVCCSMFTLAPRHLIIEPRSPKSLKIIYQVLKFAVKHKAPLNRSAFTYWEEDIPSRLDLGKSKYGGPFSTEQVEDVKTFFKIMIIFVPISIIFISVPISIIFIASYTTISVTLFSKSNECTSQLLFFFTFNLWWAIATVVYEFGVHPFIRNKLPSTLKRIGIVAVLILLINCTSLGLSTVNFNNSQFTNNTSILDFSTFYDHYWPWINQILSGAVTLFCIAAVLEFVCAQSPYNMRGLLTGFTTFIIFSSVSLNGLVSGIIYQSQRNYLYASIVYGSTQTCLSLVGFILHCVLARWYKRRVRDEDYSPHRVVEEVYDRYLSHVQ